MAYDKAKYDLIQSMKLGDLVHLMLKEFRPMDYEGPEGQSTAYFWAYERLNDVVLNEYGEDTVEGLELNS